MPKRSEWLVQEQDEGNYRVSKDRKDLRIENTLPIVMKYVQEHREATDRVYLEETDGYRTEIRPKKA